MALGLAETARLAVRIDLEGNIAKGIGGLTKQVKGLDSSLGRVGRGAGQIGAGFARAGLLVGGAAVTGLAGAAKAAIDFEDAFAGVKKTVDEAALKAAGLSFEDLEKNFRDLAKTIPISASELARLGETAGALGVDVQSIDEFVEVTAKLGVTTNLTADEAADAFGRIGTILNLTGDDYEELADSIVALGNAGASTESEITEITKRFAAQAKQAGLTKEEMVGLASVTASLGFEPERGGTALARVFANMSTNIALANKKGKAFSKLVGEPIIELQKKIDQGKGLEIFQDVLKEIKGLSATEANRTLKALGITNQSDRSIFIAMADQLPEVNRQLEVARTATGALGKEVQKRFDTVASKITVFKNNLIDAGITIGEGMIPAIGRATEKLTKFLQEPGNVNELKNLGKEIGEAIDGIDWDEVITTGKDMVGVFKSAFGWAKRIFGVFNSLPAEIKGATVGLLALNKLSGGLIGSGVGGVVGGLGEALAKSLAASIPIFGKAFVQPVFVTNMVPGGLGGGPPTPGGGGKAPSGSGRLGPLQFLRDLGKIAIPAAILTEGLIISGESISEFAAENNRMAAQAGLNAAEIEAVKYYRSTGPEQQLAFKRLGRIPTREDYNSGVAKLAAAEGNAAVAITQGTTNATMNASSIASREAAASQQRIDNVQRTMVVAQAANATMMAVHAAGQAIRDATQTQATRNAEAAARTAGVRASGATNSASAAIVGAIWASGRANRPIIQPTNVIERYQTIVRTGSTSGSRNSGPLR